MDLKPAGLWTGTSTIGGLGSQAFGLGPEKKSESEVAQSCLTLCDPVDCNPPGSSVHGILQARILELPINSPGSAACPLQILELLSLHSYLNQFLTINPFIVRTYVPPLQPYWLSFSGEP